MKKSILFILAFLLVLGCQTSKMTQGLYWEQITTRVTKSGDTLRFTQKHYLVPYKYRYEYNKSVIIVRLDREVKFNVNPEESLYVETSFSKIKEQQGRIRESIRRMRVQMDTLPPSLRWRMERDMGVKWKPEDYKIHETNETKIISGLNCKKYTITNRDELEGEFWITQDLGLINQYAGDWDSMLDKIIPVTKQDRYKLLTDKGIIVLTNINGVETLVTKMEKKMIPDSMFEIPEYYQKLGGTNSKQEEEVQSQENTQKE